MKRNKTILFLVLAVLGVIPFWDGVRKTAAACLLAASFLPISGSLFASQASGTGTSEVCVGFAPHFCARTDIGVVQETPFALPAVNVPFIGPDFGQRMVRVTTDTTLQQDSLFASYYATFYTASSSRYPAWDVYCPVSGGSGPTATCACKGCYRFESTVISPFAGTAMLFTFNPSTFQIAMGIGAPGAAYTPIPTSSHQGINDPDRLLFSLVDPDLMYTSGPFTTPSWSANSHFSAGVKVQPSTANGHQYVSNGGTSGATQPTWCTISGCTLTDGTLTWTEDGAPQSASTAAAIVGWHVTDPATYLVADLSECVASYPFFNSTDRFGGPYPVKSDTFFNIYGGHLVDSTGTNRYNQNEWNYVITYNASANTCDWWNTATGQIGTYNFNNSTQTIQGQATDSITGQQAGVIQPPSSTQFPGSFVAQGTGTGLGQGTYWIKAMYAWDDGNGYYFPSLPSATESVTLPSTCSTSGCAIKVTLPIANQSGTNGASCSSPSVSTCFFDFGKALEAIVAACGPSPTECTETIQTTAPIYSNWWPDFPYSVNAVIEPNVSNGHVYLATAATSASGATEPTWCTTSGCTMTDGGVTWKEDGALPSVTLTAIVAGAALPTTTQAGFGVHSSELDFSASFNFMTADYPYFGSIIWTPGTTKVFPFPITSTVYQGPVNNWPWHYWGGHSYLGSLFSVGDNGNTNFSLLKRTPSASDPSTMATSQIAWQTNPPCTAPNTPTGCEASQDYHPATGVGENGTTYPFYVDCYQDQDPDAHHFMMTIGGPWQREETARDPTSGAVYRFAHRRAGSFAIVAGIFDSRFNFWQSSIQEPSQDGKFVLFPTDWNGTLAGTACTGYVAGQVLCGLHESTPGGDFDGTTCALTTANAASCAPQTDLVIVELK
ncbi:MAG: hypothetical protein ACRD3D_13150 [Terriglobia bacterium]